MIDRVGHPKGNAVARALALVLVLAMCGASGAGDLSRYLWQNRLLVVFEPAAHGPDLEHARTVIVNLAEERAERDLQVITIGANEQLDLRQQFAVQDDHLTFVLIGKDGGEKARQLDQLDLPSLLALIDTMPMRQRELQQKP